MELIRDVIEWFASDTLEAVATIFPYLLVGLVGLYMLWLLIGYLRVSQVGMNEAHPPRQAVALAPPSAESGLEAVPRGVPYCTFDGLQYPIGARFCSACERDLSLDCTNCGATLNAGDASCYRCGTRTGIAEPAQLT